MAKDWTRKERSEHIKEKFHPKRKKLFVGIICLIAILLLMYGLSWSIKIGHPFLSLLFILAIAAVIPIVIFAMDMMTWESA